MPPLVSIVVPCYNAERWIEETLQSCLDQTYQPIEVVVIDDGSTDKSLDVIKSFGDKVRWETGPNRGGNHARNRGFALSTGEFIQFLDADDYLLPEKIERQVQCLETTGADLVFGDWRHQTHVSSGEVLLTAPSQLSTQSDYLESLLAGWWVAPAALLFRRSIVESAGGWDETFRAAQDRDFFISLVLVGAKVAFQPGCFSVYRRYGAASISSANLRRWLDSHCRVLDKAKMKLESQGRLTPRYRVALAQSYFSLARRYFEVDRGVYQALMKEVFTLHPAFRPRESAFYKLAQRMGGFYVAELLAAWKRKFFGPELQPGQET